MATEPATISDLVLLYRDQRPTPAISPMDIDECVGTNQSILKAEITNAYTACFDPAASDALHRAWNVPPGPNGIDGYLSDLLRSACRSARLWKLNTDKFAAPSDAYLALRKTISARQNTAACA
jgi:hypothetical protein